MIHITQKVCDKAVENFLLALKFVPYRFVTSMMIKKRDTAVFSIVFGDLDSDFVTLLARI